MPRPHIDEAHKMDGRRKDGGMEGEEEEGEYTLLHGERANRGKGVSRMSHEKRGGRSDITWPRVENAT